MDPLSQAVFGAAVAQSLPQKTASHLTERKLWLRDALIIGGLSGLAPDLDVLIRSASDPLLAIEYHRHFTHSLFVAPLMALFSTFVLWPFFKKKYLFKEIYLWALAGAATHGFLDACTSYGTHLFWPLSTGRQSWSIISIIDPLFTLPLVILCLMAWRKGASKFSRYALIWVLVYLSFGVVQHHRASDYYKQSLKTQEKSQLDVLVKPTIANLWLWRGISVFEDSYQVDGIRLGIFQDSKLYSGKVYRKFDFEPPWDSYSQDSKVIKDLGRFEFFSEGLIYQLPENDFLIGDLRYSLLPHSIEPLWVVELNKDQDPDKSLDFYHTRTITPGKKDLFYKMLLGQEIKQEELDAY